MPSDRIYITGGFNGTECMNSVEMYDSDTNQWSLITPMRSRRSGVSCITYHGCLFVIGEGVVSPFSSFTFSGIHTIHTFSECHLTLALSTPPPFALLHQYPLLLQAASTASLACAAARSSTL